MAYSDGVICMDQCPITGVRQPWAVRAGRELKRLGFRGRVVLIGDGTAQRLLQPI